ncbi:LEAF RUST 10 DISEASE-RESISTANCE LOCUS RECEPTOR-LIKE PROTEIN KINASE-like 2.1 [Lotus japonicus]|uniref:LEAF RUST 10 DISEASE-RESISTANCE LOCUS RECEPTOR-LIKE PROTEIN KINASE-like 2.1 n=1 Tax=Lotus japonicus TaxID=34305 RepID=UPI002585EB86|nr:LEAF RUST 10 DISEASE-RESISTANCE LOCUS RECEPTOR-LIKE PROTEIN KINASE-like 2.1 [Lotus japonicus]
MGIARGMDYMHSGCKTKIINSDIKAENILLDEHLSPKMSDFGLANLCAKNETYFSVSNAKGTSGYVALEVANKNRFDGILEKADVYSFGIPLRPDEGMTTNDKEILKKMTIIALWCAQKSPYDRPTMREVIKWLEGSVDFLTKPPNELFSY